MEIYFCPECEGRPYTESTKAGTKCPVCKARLQFADVSEASLAGRPKLETKGKKKTSEKGKGKPKQVSVPDKYRKQRMICGTVENIRPHTGEQRGLFTKIRHYIMYGQSFSDTLYSFDICPREDETGNDRVHVRIYGDYAGEGATICSGFTHAVRGRMALKNFSEEDNDIFFANWIRNDDTRIRFTSSPAAFMVTVFVLYFFYSVLMYFKEPAMSGEILESIRHVLTDFIGSATAAASMFSIAFIFTSFLVYANRLRTHIGFNFNSVAGISFMMTVLFFMKHKLSSFAGFTVSECFSDIFAILVTSSLNIIIACVIVYVVWRFIHIIMRLRG
jgi:hypothetical protein